MTASRYSFFPTAKISILAGFALLFVLYGGARGADVQLAWDENTESDLAGYVIYYGTESRNYPFSQDVGNVTTHTVTNLSEGQTYYFAATAYDSSQNHSGYSQELVYQIPAADTDGDGLSDSSETNIYNTSPTAADTDLDGLSDGAEVQTHQTDPLSVDTDNDGLTDGEEVGTYGTDPNEGDSDGDGLGDQEEVSLHGTDPNRADSDGDGLNDRSEIQIFYSDPNNPDTDADGLSDGLEANTHGTDPTNSDSDQDGLADGSEIQIHGTDPLDADSDQDGLTDGDEINSGSDPNTPEGNRPPDQPVLKSPADGLQNVELTPTLETQAFSDPDSGDYHRQTLWQISTQSDFSTLVFELTSDRYLTSLQVPQSLLNTDQTYYWQVRFFDRAQEPSAWSGARRFTTVSLSSMDTNQNGIPDDQEVDASSDLDEDQTPDVQQLNMKTVRVVSGDERIAIKGSANVTSIETLMSMPSSSIDEPYAKPTAMPLEMISFRIHVQQPGDTATVTIFFSDPAPADSRWYKYDLQHGWQDYSDHAVFSANRKKLTLELTDGGSGDGDGVVNGVILDPSGLGSDSDDLAAQLEDVFAGCFIGAASNSPDSRIAWLPVRRFALAVFAVGMGMLLLGLILHGLRKKAMGSAAGSAQTPVSLTSFDFNRKVSGSFLMVSQPRSMSSPH